MIMYIINLHKLVSDSWALLTDTLFSRTPLILTASCALEGAPSLWYVSALHLHGYVGQVDIRFNVLWISLKLYLSQDFYFVNIIYTFCLD